MKRHNLGLSFSFAMTTLALTGCSSSDSIVGRQDTANVPNLIQSSVPRVTQSAPNSDVRTLTTNNAAFGVNLFHAINPQTNFIESPHSISVALAMTYAGARTETHDEMARVMNFTLSEPALHAAFDTVDLALESHPTDVTDAGAQPFKLHLADSLWGQQGLAFSSDYLDELARYYGAGLRTADFANATEEARQAINGWVSDQTETKIPELLQAGLLTPDARLVLVNAIYFLGSWRDAFNTTATTNVAFNRLDASTINVPMMRGDKAKGPIDAYAEGEGWQAVELGYAGAQVSMDVVLPTAGLFTSFVSSLDGPTLTSILGQLAPVPQQGVVVTLPKFNTRSSTNLTNTLETMGMSRAFSDAADFSGMTSAEVLKIGAVVHEAMIQVDEAGTEAAAATAVIMDELSIAGNGTPPIAFTADRPFVFVIRDKTTGAVLFFGQIVDPSLG